MRVTEIKLNLLGGNFVSAALLPRIDAFLTSQSSASFPYNQEVKTPAQKLASISVRFSER